MLKRQKSGRDRDDVGERVVLIVVKVSREISRNALIWALTHVVQPGDCAKLLVVIPAPNSSRKLWKFSKFNSDCSTGKWKNLSGDVRDQKEDITESCSQMLLQLHNIYDSDKVKMKIKVISGTLYGEVAAEAKKTHTQWVVLDRNLNKEAKVCMEELECNIVMMKKTRPKVLRLNLIGSPTKEPENTSNSLEPPAGSFEETETIWNITKVPNVTPVSSPEHSSFTTNDRNTSSLSSLDLECSPFLVVDHDWDTQKDEESDSCGENMSSSPLNSDVLSSSSEFGRVNMITDSPPLNTNAPRVIFSKIDHRPEKSMETERGIVPLTRHRPHEPPSLCSICQHKAPVFGKPPKRFGFTELEEATDGFSGANFLAEGGFGSVHRGVLKDGRMVAVKQHKLASSQGDNEFYSEVDVLSCAQHRNVVMLIGFCVEDCRRLLVYEFICNSSLDSHLYGHNRGLLEWSARQKIAVGAARGLRYLHEECRVGCIVHRDMRPNNILLTHDFEPLVGDFGLARWQPDGESGVETKIIGAFGYLAPEYAQRGEITEKADVYSFGVVLVELITGRKAVDINRPKGQQYLTEWARPLLEESVISELIDPRLRDSYSEPEVRCMAHCASLCIRRDPYSRPRMSQTILIKGYICLTKTYKGKYATYYHQ
ncbi:inactive protein kinase SELMODRAFT_444075-like [Bidens hawaiensis]|uniref:inactive protein kinase SELMODRAFT_444075-like n=1 Tax=Bidens hawaiensis TaxID=980011 RepID=UPI00404B0CA8